MDYRHRTETPTVLAAISFATATLATALSGCDPQVSPFYHGESLFTVTGNVEIANNRTPGELIPALAFTSNAREEILIVDAEVQGKFPADFRLDVYDPPPKDVLLSTSELFESDERIALGFITAVPKHHHAVIRFGDSFAGQIICASDGCAQPLEPFTLSWCTSTGEITCYKETLSCSQDPVWVNDTDLPEGCEVIAREGDPSLKDPWREFAGFSQNYMVLYLPAAAPAGSYIAVSLGAPAGSGLSRGYHLLELHTLTKDENRETQACINDAMESAVAGFNEQHHTEYTVDDSQGNCISPTGCAPFQTTCEPPAAVGSGLCDRSEAEQAAVRKQLGVAIQHEEAARGCWAIAAHYKVVSDPERTSISVQIGSEQPPLYTENDENDPSQP